MMPEQQTLHLRFTAEFAVEVTSRDVHDILFEDLELDLQEEIANNVAPSLSMTGTSEDVHARCTVDDVLVECVTVPPVEASPA